MTDDRQTLREAKTSLTQKQSLACSRIPWLCKWTSKTAYTFGILEVVSPERSELVLSADVPDRERHAAARRHRLDVEADRRDCRHRLVQLQLVQQRRLACISVSKSCLWTLTNHENLLGLPLGWDRSTSKKLRSICDPHQHKLSRKTLKSSIDIS